MKNVIITLTIMSIIGGTSITLNNEKALDKDYPDTIGNQWEEILDADVEWQNSRPTNILVPRKL